MNMRDDIERVLISEEELQKRVAQIGAQISADYAGKTPTLVSVLRGSYIFMADLSRQIQPFCTVDFMAVSSYGSGTTTTGAVKINKDLTYNVEGRHILLIEDILDSGVTLSYLKKYIEARKPASVHICTLLDKPARRKADIHADYVGFECPDAFIVGYGLDYAERYRNLPYIGVLKSEIYA